jgi:hypothetical protein
MLPTPGSVLPSARGPMPRTWMLVSLLAIAITSAWGWAAPVALAAPARAGNTRAVTLTISKVTVADAPGDAKITISGHASLPRNTTAQRRDALVHLTLSAGTGKTARTETFDARLTSKDKFTVVHTTSLKGALGLEALLKISGRQWGRKVVRTIDVIPLVAAGSPTAGTPTAGGGNGGSSASGGSATGGGTQGTPLLGTFEIQAGEQAVSGALSGSYFQMLIPPTWTEPFNNGSSDDKLNDAYTLLQPGTEGGLSTTAFQPPPSPAFDGGGNALADSIVQPTSFFNVNFSIATQASDLQADGPLEEGGSSTPVTDPLPSIIDNNGVLSGQVTAWSAGWNTLWFNQGSPKPNGSYPPGTTPVSGTYNAATGQYTLHWTSYIVGGPFNNYVGSWYLAGTFVPTP